MAENVCSLCGKEILSDGFGTGYGLDKNDNKICYACCAIQDKEYMIEYGRMTLYFDDKKKVITNWPGTLSFNTPVVWSGEHNWWNCKQLYARFIGPDGKVWSGRMVDSGWTQLMNCKRTKLTNVRA